MFQIPFYESRRPSQMVYCDGINRRQALRIGSTSLLGGLTLPAIMALQDAQANPVEPRAKSCIFIMLEGGPSHIDMWDLKPDAPVEIRGDFQPIATAVPGIQVSDVLPKISRVTDKFAILRSMTHGDSDHGRGFHIMMTGQKAGAGDFNTGPKNNNQHPSVGSMVARLGKTGPLPPYISGPN